MVSRYSSCSEQRSTQGKLANVEPSYRSVMDNLSLDVPTRSLGALVFEDNLPTPAFLKTNVEGAAGQVIDGAKRLLQEAGPDIYVGLHGPEEQGGVDSLRGLGYELYDLDGNVIADLMEIWASPVWCKNNKPSHSLFSLVRHYFRGAR